MNVIMQCPLLPRLARAACARSGPPVWHGQSCPGLRLVWTQRVQSSYLFLHCNRSDESVGFRPNSALRNKAPIKKLDPLRWPHGGAAQPVLLLLPVLCRPRNDNFFVAEAGMMSSRSCPANLSKDSWEQDTHQAQLEAAAAIRLQYPQTTLATTRTEFSRPQPQAAEEELLESRIVVAAIHGDAHVLRSELGMPVAGMPVADSTLDVALHAATFAGQLRAVQLLVHQGARVNAADRHGRTPSHWAAHMGHLQCLQWLASQGASLLTAEAADAADAASASAGPAGVARCHRGLHATRARGLEGPPRHRALACGGRRNRRPRPCREVAARPAHEAAPVPRSGAGGTRRWRGGWWTSAVCGWTPSMSMARRPCGTRPSVAMLPSPAGSRVSATHRYGGCLRPRWPTCCAPRRRLATRRWCTPLSRSAPSPRPRAPAARPRPPGLSSPAIPHAPSSWLLQGLTRCPPSRWSLTGRRQPSPQRRTSVCAAPIPLIPPPHHHHPPPPPPPPSPPPPPRRPAEPRHWRPQRRRTPCHPTSRRSVRRLIRRRVIRRRARRRRARRRRPRRHRTRRPRGRCATWTSPSACGCPTPWDGRCCITQPTPVISNGSTRSALKAPRRSPPTPSDGPRCTRRARVETRPQSSCSSPAAVPRASPPPPTRPRPTSLPCVPRYSVRMAWGACQPSCCRQPPAPGCCRCCSSRALHGSKADSCARTRRALSPLRRCASD